VLSDARIAPALAGRALDAIRRNVGVQARVIGDLVDLSRLGRGRLSLQLERVDLRAVIDAAAESVAVTARARGIKLAIDTAEAGPPVHGDAARLQQVVSNLLANAIKHSGDGATVHVRVDVIAGAARIVVRDEGHGIAPDLLPHVFEPYRQGADAANSGLGLGLAIVRQLVELHGGRVEASSAGLGHGACFTVLLPAMSQAPAISPTTRTRTRSELPGR
jgi:signal transduction histidine kinase